MRSDSGILKIGIGLCLCAQMAGSLNAGEKIQFSSRNGAPAKPDTNTPAKREFQAPDFRGVTRYRKDPLEGEEQAAGWSWSRRREGRTGHG